MKKNFGAQNMIRHQIFLHPNNIQEITELLEKKSYGSISEVVRIAITALHDSQLPPYIYKEKTAAGETKRKKLEDKQKFDQISDADYAVTVLKAKILKGKDGNDYVVFHNVGNSFNVRPVEGIKKYMTETDPEAFRIHMDVLKDHSIDDRLKILAYRRDITDYWKLVLPE